MNPKNNSGVHVETLKPSIEEGDHSSVATIVTNLFSHELSGSNWKKYDKEGLLTLIEEKRQEIKISASDVHYIILMKSLKSKKKIEDCLFALTTFLLGKGL